jgi:hypothetical protein
MKQDFIEDVKQRVRTGNDSEMRVEEQGEKRTVCM